MIEVLTPEVMPATAEEFAARITLLHARSVEALLEIGQEFLAAKAALPHGEFGRVAELVGVSAATVQRYMRIAKHPTLSNAARVQLLPAAIGTLDALAAWPEEELVAALDEGVVTREMTRDEVRALYEKRTRRFVEAPLFHTEEQRVEARAAIEAGKRHANQLVRECAKRAAGMARSDEGLPDGVHLVRVAKWLCGQWQSEQHPAEVREVARQQLVELAAGHVGPAEADDVVRREIAAHRPGTPEYAMRRQDSEPVPPPAADEGTSSSRQEGVPADQGPSSSPAPRPDDGVEAASTAAPGVDEVREPSSTPSPLEGADVEPQGDDDASAPGEGSADGAGPSTEPTLEAFWERLTEKQRTALELVVTENAGGHAVRYSNGTMPRVEGGNDTAALYHQTADVLIDWGLVAFVGNTMRTELEATELGIELVLTFGKIVAGEVDGPAPEASPAACSVCKALRRDLDGDDRCPSCVELEQFAATWDDLDDAARWAQLEEPERRMLVEAMWAADADEPPYGLDDANRVQNELISLGLLEELEADDDTVGAVLTAEGLRLVRAMADDRGPEGASTREGEGGDEGGAAATAGAVATPSGPELDPLEANLNARAGDTVNGAPVLQCPQCDSMAMVWGVCQECRWGAVPQTDEPIGRSEVTDEEPDVGGYAGAQGFVEGVHDRHGGARPTAAGPDPLRVAGCEIFDILTNIEGETVPDGSSPRAALAAFILGRSPSDREEDRNQLKWWRDELNGALFLTEEVKAGGS